MRVPLVIEEHAGLGRTDEPVSVGLPLERGAAPRGGALGLFDQDGAPVLAQVRPVARWSDGSARWARVDLLATVPAHGRAELWLEDREAAPPPGAPGIEVVQGRTEVTVETGALRAVFSRQGAALVSALEAGGRPLLDPDGLRLRLEDERGDRHGLALYAVALTEAGPVRAELTLRGTLGPALRVVGRLGLYAGRGLLRLDLTVHNPRAALHPGGLWDLGDPGSVLMKDLGLTARLRSGSEGAGALLALGPGEALEATPPGRVEVYQDSSGGERWDARTHVNREGRVPLAFRGYRVTTGEWARRGDRASPTLFATGEAGALGAAVREFWQCFPKALEAAAGELRVGLWPGQAGDLHELQGGEQKTHRIWLSAERPAPLVLATFPLVARSSPEHYARSGAFPALLPRSEDEDRRLSELVDLVVDDERGLAARREEIDEYGWRNFGEVYADHEALFHEGPEPLVSHYNNQYDGVYAALAQFARSADRRWLELGDAAARHAADIDVYHTKRDRPAYSQGPFWHTDHYTDAFTSTHRCYSARNPRAAQGGYGGGPSNEHDYVAGLALHALMTGSAASREAAVGVADWVIDADDGALSRLGKVLPGPTGLSTRTVAPEYQGPGRGAGNSIHALVDVFELTRDERYLRAAETFVRRVIHPDDDREELGLVRDPENRWSYTVLLQAVLHYLEVKAELGELDDRYAYGREVVVSYARWMAENERLSSEMKDRLLLWTETWPAQDVRKGIVLMAASRLLEDEAERERMHGRGRELFDAAVDELSGWPSRDRARPLVLMSRYGYVGSWLKQRGPGSPPLPRGPALRDRGRPARFVPWKARPAYYKGRLRRALRRLRG